MKAIPKSNLVPRLEELFEEEAAPVFPVLIMISNRQLPWEGSAVVSTDILLNEHVPCL